MQTVVFDRNQSQHKLLDRNADNQHLEAVQKNGFDDFIRIGTNGLVSETAYGNLFLIGMDNIIRTPAITASLCLPGIMRTLVIAKCQAKDWPLKEAILTPQDFSHIKGAFWTNAVRGIVKINQVNTTKFHLDTPFLDNLSHLSRMC